MTLLWCSLAVGVVVTALTAVYWERGRRVRWLVRTAGPLVSFTALGLALFILANKQIALYPTWQSILGGH